MLRFLICYTFQIGIYGSLHFQVFFMGGQSFDIDNLDLGQTVKNCSKTCKYFQQRTYNGAHSYFHLIKNSSRLTYSRTPSKGRKRKNFLIVFRNQYLSRFWMGCCIPKPTKNTNFSLGWVKFQIQLFNDIQTSQLQLSSKFPNSPSEMTFIAVFRSSISFRIQPGRIAIVKRLRVKFQNPGSNISADY